MAKKYNLIGKKFGKLTVISKIGSVEFSKNKFQIQWKCICECGNYKITPTTMLNENKVMSCGCLKAHYKKDIKGVMAKRVYSNYNDGDIKFEDFLRLSQQDCYYCDAPPSNCMNYYNNYGIKDYENFDDGSFIYNGLDRVDNNIKEHTLKNCVPCCRRCNWAKGNMTFNEYINHVKKICEYQIINPIKQK